MTLELDFVERRVLGVLVEKALTTPEQYPLTLNGVVVGSNQKSCRDPLSGIDEEAALDALERLRRKGLTVLVRTEGSRADRWKHRVVDALGIEVKDAAILAELLLRGPQTDGELRQRAGRMSPQGELDEVVRRLEALCVRPEPLVVRLTSPGRKRGARFAHALYPAAERPDPSSDAAESEDAGSELSVSEAERRVPSRSPESRPSESETRGREPSPAFFEARSAASPPGSGTPPAFEERMRSLEKRVSELEETFVKFLR